jgi:hypothetical protein
MDFSGSSQVHMGFRKERHGIKMSIIFEKGLLVVAGWKVVEQTGSFLIYAYVFHTFAFHKIFLLC